MILVDVFVPALNRIYDFKVNENVPVSMVAAEISEMLAKQEKSEIISNKKDFILCCSDTMQILPGNLTLYNCGVHNGYRIILV